MDFYGSGFDDFGEYKYNYYSTPNYSASYDMVPFQNSSSSLNDSITCYDIVPFQNSSSTNYESNCYDVVPFQDPSCYSEPNVFEYDPYTSNNAYYPVITSSEVNYSSYNFVEPKLLEYNPIFCNTHYFSSNTRFIISYSNAFVLDDTEFDEYDPTPYDGGYDIAQTYGKPLQPSDQICYPHSVPAPENTPPINSSYGSIPSPYVNSEKEIKKIPISEPILEKEQPSGGNEGSNVKELEKAVESEGYNSDNREKNGDNGNYGYGSYGKPIIEFQGTYNNGYGLEAMDLCEGLFGYWPCLDKKIRKECGNCKQVVVASEENDQWKSAADYLFGNCGYYNYD